MRQFSVGARSQHQDPKKFLMPIVLGSALTAVAYGGYKLQSQKEDLQKAVHVLGYAVQLTRTDVDIEENLKLVHSMPKRATDLSWLDMGLVLHQTVLSRCRASAGHDVADFDQITFPELNNMLSDGCDIKLIYRKSGDTRFAEVQVLRAGVSQSRKYRVDITSAAGSTSEQSGRKCWSCDAFSAALTELDYASEYTLLTSNCEDTGVDVVFK